jgi:predicted esterase
VHTIAAGVHGRYLVGGPSRAHPAGLLVGFHGYAQNAALMAADLETIDGAGDWLRVSVQGLHRFYTKSGQVVASWMTSEDRELAIADNVAYVAHVVEQVRAGHADRLDAGAPVVLLGFSQGTAMAYRAAAAASFPCAGVIALGGDVPPEIRASSARLPPVLLGHGSADEWYTHEKLAVDVAYLEGASEGFTICEFAGGHEWTDAFRAEAAAFLRALVRHPAR